MAQQRATLTTNVGPHEQFVPKSNPARIHILGMGSVGQFIAHSLAGTPGNKIRPPITLLYNRPNYLAGLKNLQTNLRLITLQVPEDRGPFDVELAFNRNKTNLPEHEDNLHRMEDYYSALISSEPIQNLILTTKAPQSVSALLSVKHRLSPESTILFLQNGMGTVDEVNERVFPDPMLRPRYMVGVNSHGTHAQGPFETTHAGHGIIYLTILPHARDMEKINKESTATETSTSESGLFEAEDSSSTSALVPQASTSLRGETGSSTPHSATLRNHWKYASSSRYLLRALARIPVLAAVPVSPEEFFTIQLEKLAVNCIINPLTVMLDNFNGSILYNFPATRAMRLLLSEISLVYQSLPELRDVPGIDYKFSPARLEQFVLSIAEKTNDNISSMLQDVRRGYKTEVDYMNGYIVKRGEETGTKPAMNYLMMQMVKAKTLMISRELEGYVPFSDKDLFGKRLTRKA